MSWKSSERNRINRGKFPYSSPLSPPPLPYLNLISRGHQGPRDDTALLALKFPPPLCYKAGNFLQHDKQQVFTVAGTYIVC